VAALLTGLVLVLMCGIVVTCLTQAAGDGQPGRRGIELIALATGIAIAVQAYCPAGERWWKDWC